MAEAGKDPDAVRLASFREHGAHLEDAVERAKAVVTCAVLGVPFDAAAIAGGLEVNPATLVIGGGVAGIQAALEISNAGKEVYLVEKTGTIGGHMAMFDKTFPTLDCAACILTPKMVSVGQDPNIHLWTRSEVVGVEGVPGSFRVRVKRHPRRVDEEACISCNLCAEKCPASVPSEFDHGVVDRKAIYLPFPQAVPNTYLIDDDSCIYIQSEGKRCGVCAKVCPKECIDLNAAVEEVEIEIGNIILATGYQVFDAKRIPRYGYGKYPNVLTSLEFERLTNAAGPTGGKIVTRTVEYNKRKKSDEWVFKLENKPPRSVAIIHCVGSRDLKYNKYCSRVCCMYSLKFAHLVKEKLPDAECYEFYIDMRAFGKGYEDFFERIKDEGVHVVRGRSAEVVPIGNMLMVKGEDIIGEKVLELPVDMVILSVGLQPRHDSIELAELLGLRRGDDGWFEELNYNTDPTGTEHGGVFVAGVCQGPKDIPDTVAQASGVACRVLKSIVGGRISQGRNTVTREEIETRARSLAGV
jgi:heterodisulfide reductase subunit A